MDETLIGEANTSRANREVWLVKVPQFLAETWSSMPENSNLGNISISKTESEVKMSIKLEESYAKNIPKEYSLFYTDAQNTPMEIFSEENDEELAMEGLVRYRCDLKPHYGTEYRHLLRNRVEKSNTKARVLKTIDTRPTMGAAPFARKEAKKQEKVKRERMDKGVLTDKLFELFEKEPFYDIHTLVHLTNQPQQYLKEILSELCIQRKSGPHKGAYELRPDKKVY